MINLDYLCIKHAQKMPRDKESEIKIRKALGVLQEDGVYAMFLWINYKNANVIIEKLVELLNEPKIKNKFLTSENFTKDFKNLCNKLQKISENIDMLFFLKKILERTLTYALYHAKIGE